jgi:hypothetical protein
MRYLAIVVAVMGLALTFNPRCNMRFMAFALTALGLALVASHPGKADEKEALAIIDKASVAHGIKDAKGKSEGYVGKNKGTAHVQGLDLEFTQEVSILVPSKFREVMNLNVMNNQISVITTFDGKNASITANGQDIPIQKEMLEEFKESAHMMRLMQAAFLKDKSLKFGLLGETQVNGKAAAGVKVSKDGYKDIDFYFDKGTGLIAKVVRRAMDLQSGQEVTEERIIKEYHDLDGRKVAKKLEVLRDSKIYLEVEVLEGRFVETLDDSLFTKPGE